MSEQTYNLANIRDLLIQGFDDGELRALCFDMTTFRPVYDQLGNSTGKAEIVAKLLEHADKTIQLDSLLALARERNPARYQRHGPYTSAAISNLGVETRLAELPLETIPTAATLPAGSRMPFGPNPLFVGREGDLLALAQALKG